MSVSLRVRPARHEDVPRITPWTTGTFDWGDYVPERLPRWIDDPESEALVCLDHAGTPVGVTHVLMLSRTEAWLEGARVHPDHRRSGVGIALNDAGVDWARSRGARVVRLATETENVAAIRQVDKLGYRRVSSWMHGRISVDVGAIRLDQRLRLQPAPGSDVDPAWLFWAASDLALAGRELLAESWRWRRARPDDLAGAAQRGELLQSVAGWVVVEHPEPDWMQVGWLVCTPEDAPALVEAVVDRARELGVTEVSLMVPNLPWATETLSREGAQPSEVVVLAKRV